MVFTSGPINVQQGNGVEFTVEFLDTSGNIASPVGGTITVTYTNISNSSQSDIITLNPIAYTQGSVFTGIWTSAQAALGLATWTTTSLPSSVQATTGQIRIIQRKGG